jgi:eukaryotic-like serine/threonine-protein kinase
MLEIETSPVTDPLSMGELVLKRYRILERYTVGGHSVVYRGEDERLSRQVCVKVFHSLLADSELWQTTYEHFIQEAFALSKLMHPNTLRIFDFGHLPASLASQRGAPFQVSEFMNGGTLSSLIRINGPMSKDDLFAVVDPLCAALAEAHSVGIVHRDIKPKNILFGLAGPSRIPKLADFGIAKSQPRPDEFFVNRARDTAVVAGRPLMMCSPKWAAPEQIAGEPVDPSVDVYSMALVTVFMLTGQIAFPAADPERAMALRSRSDEVLDKALDVVGVPAPVAAVIKRACSFQRSDRPADILEFNGQLRRAFSPAEPVASFPDFMDEDSDVPTMNGRAGPSRRIATEPTEPRPRRPTAPPRRLHLGDDTQPIGDRMGRFLAVGPAGCDVDAAEGARLRVRFVPTSTGNAIHVKGLTCFVAGNGGRPTAAVQMDDDGYIELVSKRRKAVARAEISFGRWAPKNLIFDVCEQSVAVDAAGCLIVALDFGSGADCLFLYQRVAGSRPL